MNGVFTGGACVGACACGRGGACRVMGEDVGELMELFSQTVVEGADQ
jgi:hypothetical protein